jgi:hypothetical protein
VPAPCSAPGVPKELTPFFQEYDLLQLDLDRDAKLIMQRVLEHGTWDEVLYSWISA